MREKNESEARVAESPDKRSGVYIDSSAFAKLYVPEPESDALDEYLQGRRDLIISDLTITEVISAVARRKREGVLNSKQAREIHAAVISDMKSGSFRCLDSSPTIHREAERMLRSTESVPLRTLDALHVALAISGSATLLITFDNRLAEAASLQGLQLVRLS
jgi:predicted nucleic acid-binding protein